MADDLGSRLAAVLPAGHTFGVYHLSTPPTRTDALFHAPPGQRPDRTYIESHFLAVTITTAGSTPPITMPPSTTAKTAVTTAKAAAADGEVIAFALEIFVFTTAYATTLFVAKADSSGYLHLLHLAKGTPSPIRAVTSTFLAYLVDQRQRPGGVQTVVSLFARAQSQYLFPGSVDNEGKHVLDDRGLVKWWCRVLDPLLEAGGEDKEKAHGYLVVPGLDQYETRSFLPRRPGSAPSPHWTLGHPLETISHYCAAGNRPPPPRCLVPRYPDDPKARYLDELDDEAERGHEKKRTAAAADDEEAKEAKEAKQAWNGQWKSVRSLDQFWEMMAFRQECSSGRLTGFIWVVLPTTDGDLTVSNEADAAAAEKEQTKTAAAREKTKKTTKKTKKRKVLRGYIVSRRPRPKTQQRNRLAALPANTPYYRWPAAGRGRLLVDDSDYKRINELLLQLDFSTLEKGVSSTRRWVQEASVGTGDWRMSVEGKQAAVGNAKAANGDAKAAAAAEITDLSGLVKRKRAPSEADGKTGAQANGVNVLSAGLVRKKQKSAECVPEEPAPAAPTVNVLSAGLVRKKPKV
ncbi:hypothetical protein SCUCBS95973_002943 [Sporothrix curviconia]|uniref:histone acetyltransferase n=1 Tax=Sporothrix curviconia TaxID=1260050 RepID=A0ABP0BB76_9PEZI